MSDQVRGPNLGVMELRVLSGSDELGGSSQCLIKSEDLIWV